MNITVWRGYVEMLGLKNKITYKLKKTKKKDVDEYTIRNANNIEVKCYLPESSSYYVDNIPR